MYKYDNCYMVYLKGAKRGDPKSSHHKENNTYFYNHEEIDIN